MTQASNPAAGATRRALLGALAAALAGGRVRAAEASPYVLEQGERTVPLSALSAGEPVESFYDYRSPRTVPSGRSFSSRGTGRFQHSDGSVLFLYDGPEGLSLVVVHDAVDDRTGGGAATFRFSGLPVTGEWAVADDRYEGASNYDRWEREGTTAVVDWTWGPGRTDGGAFHGLGDEFDVTIDPGFNEAASLYGEYYDGRVRAWEALSGGTAMPRRIGLAMDRPVRIRTRGYTRPETGVPEAASREGGGADGETERDGGGADAGGGDPGQSAGEAGHGDGSTTEAPWWREVVGWDEGGVWSGREADWQYAWRFDLDGLSSDRTED